MSEISAFGINFSRFQGIFKFENFNSMYKTHPDFETKIGGKKVCLIHRRIRYVFSYLIPLKFKVSVTHVDSIHFRLGMILDTLSFF